MSNNLAAWLYLAGAAAVTAVVVQRSQRVVLARPGETVALLGDDLAEHVRRPLRHVLRSAKRDCVAPRTGGTWRTHHAMLGVPLADQVVVLAAGLTPPSGPREPMDSAADIARFCRLWPRMVVVVVPGSPGAEVLAAGAREAGAVVCELRPCPELAERRAGAGGRPCAPTLATSAGWAAEIAHRIL